MEEEKKLIEKKVEAEIVKQKSITEMEQSLVTTEHTVEQEIKKTRKTQWRHERIMRHKREGSMTLEKIAEQEVAAITTQYETEKK